MNSRFRKIFAQRFGDAGNKALGDGGARYYAVDHSPSYLWNTATRNISRALRPFIRDVLSGPEAWQANPTLRRSIRAFR